MINFTIPGFWERQNIIITLLILYKKYNYIFLPNINIESVYGNFKHTIWDGGRSFAKELNLNQASYTDIELFQDIYNNFFHIPVRFIFTNCLLTEEHCKDEFCNFILKTFSKNNNDITINSNILENYILEHYDNFKLISSITKALNENEIIIELEKPQYDLICLPFQINKNIQFLNTIPEELKQKCEFLVNTPCKINCCVSKQHYIADSLSNLTQQFPIYNFKCPNEIPNYRNIPSATLNKETILQYSKQDFCHYKINGRLLTLPIHLIKSLNYYLIQPQYYTFFIMYMLQGLTYFEDKTKLLNLNLNDF